MRRNLLYLIVFIAFTFPAISALGYFRVQNDSISKPIALLKKYIGLEEGKILQIRIINSHNGRYIITSTITTKGDSLQLKSHVKNMIGGQRDTVLHFRREEFMQKLDGILIRENFLKIAGHYKTISIKRGADESEFGTTEGRGLMNLLEYGE